MRILRSFLAAIVLAALIVAIPYALIVMVGNPLHVWPDLAAGDVSNRVIMATLAAVAWILWAQFTLATIAEFISAARHVRVPHRIPGIPRLHQGLARTLVSAVLMITPAVVSIAGPTLAMAAPAPAVVGAGQVAAATAISDTAAAAGRHAAPDIDTATVTIGVDSPHTWWDLAEKYAGDGANWRGLYELNADMPQEGGARPTETRPLRDGWVLTVPAPAERGTDDQAAATSDDAGELVTVEDGDTLSGIAAETTGDAARWPELFDASKDTAQPGRQPVTDPNLIFPGQVITIPADIGTGQVAAAQDADEGHAPVATTGDSSQTVAEEDSMATPPQSAEPVAVPADAPAATEGTDAQISGDEEGRVPAEGAYGTAPQARAGALAEKVPARTASSGVAQSAEASAGQASNVDWPSWLTALGGGAVLAGALTELIRRGRARSLRTRRVGRVVPVIPDELAATARAVVFTDETSDVDLVWLERALRFAVSSAATVPGGRVPDVVAVRVSAKTLELVLAAPADAPAPTPWIETAGGLRWQLDRGEEFTIPEQLTGRYDPPLFPLLVTVGHEASGAVWLLDLEMIGSLRLAGDAGRATDLMRYMALELGVSTFSEQSKIFTFGFGSELDTPGLWPVRVDQLDEAVETAQSGISMWVDATRDNADRSSAACRLTDDVDGCYEHTVVLTAETEATTNGQLANALAPLGGGHGRLGTAVVGLADAPLPNGWSATINDDGVLSIPQLGAQLIAEQLPVDEAADVAAVVSAVRPFKWKAAPADAPARPAEGDKPIDQYTTTTGALRDEHTGPEPPPGPHLPGEPVRAGSLLPKAADEYEATNATLAANVAALAPVVSPDVREKLVAADPTLDVDVADWREPTSARPKITVLGAVNITAGEGEEDCQPQLVELAVYLAMHPSGVTRDKAGTDLLPTNRDPLKQFSKLASRLRDALGGARHLSSPRVGGKSLYRLDEAVLVDADLARRLRARALARGDNGGITDLQTALEVVAGRPFDALRPGGYAWLAAGVWEQDAAVMVDEIAHLAVVYYLDHGDARAAQDAAQVAMRAGVGSDTPMIDYAAALTASGMSNEADKYIRKILDAYEYEHDADLIGQVAQLLRSPRWNRIRPNAERVWEQLPAADSASSQRA